MQCHSALPARACRGRPPEVSPLSAGPVHTPCRPRGSTGLEVAGGASSWAPFPRLTSPRTLLPLPLLLEGAIRAGCPEVGPGPGRGNSMCKAQRKGETSALPGTTEPGTPDTPSPGGSPQGHQRRCRLCREQAAASVTGENSSEGRGLSRAASCPTPQALELQTRGPPEPPRARRRQLALEQLSH